MKIQVLQIDIDNGVRCDGRACALALAVERSFPDKRVSIGVETIYIQGQPISMSPKVVRFRRHFDSNGRHHAEVKPFEFELEVDCT